MQLFVVFLGVHALIRREQSGSLSPVPRAITGEKCEHRVFPVKVPTDLSYEKLELVGEHLEALIVNRGLSIDRDRNVVKKVGAAVKLFKATEQWVRLEKLTEGEYKGRMRPFVNFAPLKEEANVWGWFGSKPRTTEPILVDILRGFFGDEDYAKVADVVGDLKWGKYTKKGKKLGNVHLDFPSTGTGFTMWVLLPKKMVQLLDADAKHAVKMRFSLVQMLGDDALIEAVAEITTKTRVKEVFQTNHFRECDKIMMNDLRDFIPTRDDEDSNGRLKDLFDGDDTRKKNVNCIVPEKPFNPQITQATDDGFRALISHAMSVPGGIKGIADKESAYNNALDVSDKSGGMTGFFNNLDIVENMGFGESYTHGGDMFPRWYFYVMQRCHETSASSCPTCQKYNKAPGRWGPFVGQNGLVQPPFKGLAMRSDPSGERRPFSVSV